MITTNGNFNFLDIFLSTSDNLISSQVLGTYFIASNNARSSFLSKRVKRLSKRK
jgi:hypothetical protein